MTVRVGMGLYGVDSAMKTKYADAREAKAHVAIGVHGETMFFTVEEARKFAAFVYQVAARVDKRLKAEGAEAAKTVAK